MDSMLTMPHAGPTTLLLLPPLVGEQHLQEQTRKKKKTKKSSSCVVVYRRPRIKTMACTACRRAHLRCNEALPCKHCIEKGQEAHCHPAVAKQRGRHPKYSRITMATCKDNDDASNSSGDEEIIFYSRLRSSRRAPVQQNPRLIVTNVPVRPHHETDSVVVDENAMVMTITTSNSEDEQLEEPIMPPLATKDAQPSESAQLPMAVTTTEDSTTVDLADKQHYDTTATYGGDTMMESSDGMFWPDGFPYGLEHNTAELVALWKPVAEFLERRSLSPVSASLWHTHMQAFAFPVS